MSPAKFDVRAGDQWEFTTNGGVIPRFVQRADKNGVEYTNAGGARRACAVATFRRWCRGAQLVAASDWSDR